MAWPGQCHGLPRHCRVSRGSPAPGVGQIHAGGLLGFLSALPAGPNAKKSLTATDHVLIDFGAVTRAQVELLVNCPGKAAVVCIGLCERLEGSQANGDRFIAQRVYPLPRPLCPPGRHLAQPDFITGGHKCIFCGFFWYFCTICVLCVFFFVSCLSMVHFAPRPQLITAPMFNNPSPRTPYRGWTRLFSAV